MMLKSSVAGIDWRRLGSRLVVAGLLILVTVNLIADVAKVAQVAHLGLAEAATTRGSDFLLMSQASRTVLAGGDPYAGTTFMWTPLGAVAFYPVTLIGWHPWQLAHIAGALAMPSWRMRLLVLFAYPFWSDVELGNILVFVLLTAVWAIRGNSIGIAAFLVLTILVPRPLMLPIASWLLWRHPGWRLPFLVMALAALLATAGMGLLGPFIERSLTVGDVLQYGWAPSRFVGPAWLVLAWPLAAWLTWRGRLGLASLLASPYWLVYYLLLPLADADRRSVRVLDHETA